MRTIHNHRYLLGGSDSGEVLCWDVQTQGLLMKKRLGSAPVSVVEWAEHSDEVLIGRAA